MDKKHIIKNVHYKFSINDIIFFFHVEGTKTGKRLNAIIIYDNNGMKFVGGELPQRIVKDALCPSLEDNSKFYTDYYLPLQNDIWNFLGNMKVFLKERIEVIKYINDLDFNNLKFSLEENETEYIIGFIDDKEEEVYITYDKKQKINEVSVKIKYKEIELTHIFKNNKKDSKELEITDRKLKLSKKLRLIFLLKK